MKGEIRHICMAEDDPDDYYFFSKILNEINDNVKLTWFQTCEDLLLFLKADSDLPSLIILDMNLPRMGGHNCLTAIKKEGNLNHIPVIIFSTAGQPSSIKMAYQAGAHKYMLKPFSLDEFRKIIQEILATPLGGQ
jgi:CheY-like chemotaxis protein